MKPTHIYAEVLEDEALAQFTSAMNHPYVVSGALMPDAHTGYSLPIGAVVAVKDHISPAFVGYDIGCGVFATKLNMKCSELRKEEIFKLICEHIPVGREQHQEPQSVPVGECSKLVEEHLERKGRYQMGTLGGGNHFIELGEGRDGHLWIVIHSGSRNLGHAVAEHYMELCARNSINFAEVDLEFEGRNLAFKQRNPEGYQKALEANRKKAKVYLEGQHFFHVDSPEGQAYLTDMEYCLRYALSNRKHIAKKIIEFLGNPEQLEWINRNHNHAEFEDGLWIHRKGATHAESGMLGVIPGNMRDGSFIVRGKGNPDSLCSSSHGAGRVLSRKKALATLDLADFNLQMANIITNHTSSTLDEAPAAYKSIFEVMELQKDLVTIIDHIKPIINIKG